MSFLAAAQVLLARSEAEKSPFVTNSWLSFVGIALQSCASELLHFLPGNKSSQSMVFCTPKERRRFRLRGLQRLGANLAGWTARGGECCRTVAPRNAPTGGHAGIQLQQLGAVVVTPRSEKTGVRSNFPERSTLISSPRPLAPVSDHLMIHLRRSNPGNDVEEGNFSLMLNVGQKCPRF